MNIWFIVGFILLIFILAILVKALEAWLDKFRRPEYEYEKRMCIMTESERKCFIVLLQAVGDKYYVFPQIHLPTFLNHKIVGQNWNGAFRHIDEKSVDFVLCDKEKLCPILAIELDDRTHELPNRQERDREVERILKFANMPLLRLEHKDISDIENLTRKIMASMPI